MTKFSIYKDNVINALEALANRDFQEVAWFPNDKNLMYSYNESVEDAFYNSTIDDALKAGEIIFGKKEDDALRSLEKETQQLDDFDYPTDILINLPQMQAIREKAAYALKLIKSSDHSNSTIEFLNIGEKPSDI